MDADLVFYLSVRCGPSAGASYKLLATEFRSALQNGVSVHGEVCPGGFVYHHWEHYFEGELRSVKFKLTMHSGDGAIAVRHGASFSEAPLKLAPPYLELTPGTHHSEIEYCNAKDAVTSHDHVYVLIAGGHHCLSYELVSEEEPNEVCHALDASSGQGHGYGTATHISPHHFVYGSCIGSDWVDYSLTLTAADYHYNYLIEVEDLTASETTAFNDRALALHLFDNAIPNDRHTEHVASQAIDGIYSVAINMHNFHAGERFFSIQCAGGDFNAVRRFRTVIFQVEQILQLDHEYHGEVCPGEWVYHSYDVPLDGSATEFEFFIEKHMGDMEVVVRHAIAPLKLIPPFQHLDEADHHKETQVCHAEPGERIYLGMLGGLHCASYEISAHVLPAGNECNEPAHYAEASGSSKVDPSWYPLVVDRFHEGSCGAFGWHDMYFTADDHDMHNNMLFELTDMSGGTRIDSLSVYMFVDYIPQSRKSEFAVHKSCASLGSEHAPSPRRLGGAGPCSLVPSSPWGGGGGWSLVSGPPVIFFLGGLVLGPWWWAGPWSFRRLGPHVRPS